MSQYNRINILSHEVPTIVGFNPHDNVKNIIKRKRELFNNNFTMTNQTKMIDNDNFKTKLIQTYCDTTGYKLVTTLSLFAYHPQYNFLLSTIDAICIDSFNNIRLVKFNLKKNVKYNDITSNKIAAHHFCELQVILDCFQCDSIDFVRYRINYLDILNVKSNRFWIENSNIFNKLSTFFESLPNLLSN